MTSAEDSPADPMDDSDLVSDPPPQSDAVEAARQMNDPDGAQPGALDQSPRSDGDAPVTPTPD